MATRSVTTVGGCSFDDLCRGVKNYVCDASCLVDLIAGEDNAVQEAVSRICQKLEENLFELETQMDSEIERFYIGKTYIRKRKKHGGGFQHFDPMNPNTWKKNGISSRWGQHKKTEYGSDGMIVLAAVTREAVPEGYRTQQDYALMLEQKLIHHYYSDSRLANGTLGEGMRDKAGSIAYALYVAFHLTSNDNCDEPELIPPSPAQPSLPTTSTVIVDKTYRPFVNATSLLPVEERSRVTVPENEAANSVPNTCTNIPVEYCKLNKTVPLNTIQSSSLSNKRIRAKPLLVAPLAPHQSRQAKCQLNSSINTTSVHAELAKRAQGTLTMNSQKPRRKPSLAALPAPSKLSQQQSFTAVSSKPAKPQPSTAVSSKPQPSTAVSSKPQPSAAVSSKLPKPQPSTAAQSQPSTAVSSHLPQPQPSTAKLSQPQPSTAVSSSDSVIDLTANDNTGTVSTKPSQSQPSNVSPQPQLSTAVLTKLSQPQLCTAVSTKGSQPQLHVSTAVSRCSQPQLSTASLDSVIDLTADGTTGTDEECRRKNFTPPNDLTAIAYYASLEPSVFHVPVISMGHLPTVTKPAAVAYSQPLNSSALPTTSTCTYAQLSSNDYAALKKVVTSQQSIRNTASSANSANTVPAVRSCTTSTGVPILPLMESKSVPFSLLFISQTESTDHIHTDTSVSKKFKQSSQQSSDATKPIASTIRRQEDVTARMTTSLATSGQKITLDLERKVNAGVAVHSAQIGTMTADKSNNGSGHGTIVKIDSKPISSSISSYSGSSSNRKRPGHIAENSLVRKKLNNKQTKATSKCSSTTCITSSSAITSTIASSITRSMSSSANTSSSTIVTTSTGGNQNVNYLANPVSETGANQSSAAAPSSGEDRIMALQSAVWKKCLLETLQNKLT